jgi:hypothetical protein
VVGMQIIDNVCILFRVMWCVSKSNDVVIKVKNI